MERAFIPLGICILTVSDTRTAPTDTSGQVLLDRLLEAGHLLVERALVRDEVAEIRKQVAAWTNRPDVDVVISTGGTGLTGRDVTVEAMRGLFDKEIEGFGVAFHIISFGKIGASTVQSRATAGVSKGKYIFCLPGSPGACRDGWDGILKLQLDYRHLPCNFVEIMPRLEEHLRRKKG
ncbi:MAG: molybdenum cofactor biosynthesis protein B [Pseudomonadota bacterium]|nr:molybdenum cofactor biosynthesis protein B [Pseudomonadota bacterium]